MEEQISYTQSEMLKVATAYAQFENSMRTYCPEDIKQADFGRNPLDFYNISRALRDFENVVPADLAEKFERFVGVKKLFSPNMKRHESLTSIGLESSIPIRMSS